ncbi:polysaccharide/O-antigene exporter permease protein [Acetobacter aceti NRIC 0242]|uniref:Sugar ABC transporter permease n=1 Tax=Acetobacter aceti NBRC 14818 TaxID=887700 RepID=A0AB33IHK7_ACEAC|nr:ABC transporter permease [Acetobacter aceti]TCS35248.1 lipopolysaccharide transport system permease protein [Acetobacter aceti NBRC 14818]BCK75364.1 sugar ABC transporter permease [Acetobacter aceti NBRC 14818]GAN57344.1 ABC transporter polysaccharide/O-antigene exporter [Acetobacter aceti NBRC 14818]GBO81448.1 polysaccharide/O-antigene exporter permease protein [Acetobacter aceti NRIC 0242]
MAESSLLPGAGWLTGVAADGADGLRGRTMTASTGQLSAATPIIGDFPISSTQESMEHASLSVGEAAADRHVDDWEQGGPDDDPAVSHSRLRLALADIGEGLRLWRLAVSLGWLDIKLQFRGSRVGPLWLTLGTAVMIGSMGGIYSNLFHIVLKDYLPYLAISMILWQIGIAGVTQDACSCFINAASSIRATRLPFSLQALRVLVRNGLMFGYNIVVPIGVYLIFGLLPGPVALFAVPGLLIWALNAFAFCLLLGSVAARYRDIPPIVASIVQVAFYVTPIIWSAKQLGAKGWWLIFNPFYPLLEIVRQPLTGEMPSISVWSVAIGLSVLLWLSSLFVFSRSRAQLAFWI